MNDNHYPAGTEKGGQFAPKNFNPSAFVEDKNSFKLVKEFGITPNILQRQSKIDELSVGDSKEEENKIKMDNEDIIRLCENELKNAERNEASITSQMKILANFFDADLVGLEHKIKSPESLYNKIYTNITKYGETLESVIGTCTDTVRYTMLFPKDNFTNNVKSLFDSLIENGYTIKHLKNRYITDDKNSGYRDINVRLVAPNGQKFELQVNFPEAYELKTGMYKVDGKWQFKNKLNSHFYYKEKNRCEKMLKKGNLDIESLNFYKERLTYCDFMCHYLFRNLEFPEKVEEIRWQNYPTTYTD